MPTARTRRQPKQRAAPSDRGGILFGTDFSRLSAAVVELYDPFLSEILSRIPAIRKGDICQAYGRNSCVSRISGDLDVTVSSAWRASIPARLISAHLECIFGASMPRIRTLLRPRSLRPAACRHRSPSGSRPTQALQFRLAPQT
ncbi:putative predicted protein [Rhizobium favelukesii]|uniref:Uncharacterized protein n=1 Tax=Rhizobium favelukesii TaxID=348824 RepID=W6RZY8_9HYPH|nr:putative predicted protein [Rhizobium favelukesii]